MSSPQAVGVFGGSFNPPHIGHVLACHYALCAWPLQRILIIPSYRHPFGKALEPFEHRMQMTRLAFQHLGENVQVSSLEEEMRGVSYTIETLLELRRREPTCQLHLIIGSDILAEATKWKSFDEISKIAPLLVIPRLEPGNQDAITSSESHYVPGISSSDVRQQILSGNLTSGAVPLPVMDYIRQHQLYSANA